VFEELRWELFTAESDLVDEVDDSVEFLDGAWGGGTIYDGVDFFDGVEEDGDG
jgi:hypothetical protein